MMGVKRGKSGFEVVAVPKPTLKADDDVLIKVIAAGINPVDYKAPAFLVGPVVVVPCVIGPSIIIGIPGIRRPSIVIIPRVVVGPVAASDILGHLWQSVAILDNSLPFSAFSGF